MPETSVPARQVWTAGYTSAQTTGETIYQVQREHMQRFDNDYSLCSPAGFYAVYTQVKNRPTKAFSRFFKKPLL